MHYHCLHLLLPLVLQAWWPVTIVLQALLNGKHVTLLLPGWQPPGHLLQAPAHLSEKPTQNTHTHTKYAPPHTEVWTLLAAFIPPNHAGAHWLLPLNSCGLRSAFEECICGMLCGRYIPAGMADCREVGTPGVLTLKLLKVSFERLLGVQSLGNGKDHSLDIK